jgi:class 3 adenylate cyclase/DNA-binding SARP family transcriptional activator
LEFRVLGPLEVLDGQRSVPLGGAKPRALLAVLLLHAGEVASTERLVEELWGDDPPATAQKLVQGYVHALRKHLDDVLITQPPGYRLALGEHTLDLAEFRRLAEQARSAPPDEGVELLRRALALWHGPPLADVAFEGPSRHEVGHLAELRLTTQIERIDAELQLGRHERVVGELEALVAAHPYQERLHGQLMLALYRSGRQAEALAAYQAVRRTLSDELGLEPGHALRELEAAILRQDPSLSVEGAATPAPPSPAPAETPPPAPTQDELRPVTILFADIVGSTGLGERLAPEDVKALVGECVTQMARAVEEYGGAVQAYEGDGICAYFGVPHAHEDDPERAARTGLRIQEVAGAYARDIADAWGIPDFAVRVGINTGRAAVGSVGARNRQTVALGDATNVAARIQSAAESGTIAVGEETARRLAHRFDFEPLGDLTVKGRAEPVRAARLTAPRAPTRGARLRPLVGREREVEQLRATIAELEAGRGQALLLVGDPGIGKTRLLAELRSLLPERVTWLEGHCLSYGGLPSWPFIEVLRSWLGLELGDPEVVVRTRAHARLAPLLDDDPTGALSALARLLRISLGTGSGTPAEGESDIGAGYVAWVEALTALGPVVLAIEDLHWAHASSRELAEELLGLTERAPLLLVATLRRDPGSEGWRFRTRVLADFSHRSTELALAPLSAAAATDLLGTLLPGAFDEETREELVARAEGNPLYLEELLRALVEGGGLEQRHRTWTTTLKPSLLLPPALENLLVARVDRLADGPRRLAQLAAAIGREFPVPALERVAGGAVNEDLAGLLRAEIVRELRRYPELVCAFRHGLLQEAVLTTLTPATRRELYGRVAAAFEELYAGSLHDHLERLAHYHAQAGDVRAAGEYLVQAAADASELDLPSRRDELRRRASKLQGSGET